MVIWMVFIIIKYFLAPVGLIANLLYIKLVVFNQSIDGFCRIASLIISTAFIFLLISNTLGTSLCLFYGSIFYSGPCVKNDVYLVTAFFHSYAESSIGAGIFILVFERYASVFFPSFRLSPLYKISFSFILFFYILYVSFYMYMMRVVRSQFTLILSTVSLFILYISSFSLVIYLYCAARKRYYETVGLLSLTKRFMLSESYELCCSCLPATFCCLAINIFIFISFWCFMLNWIPISSSQEFAVLAFTTLDLSATLFPILFLTGSRKIRRKIGKIFPFSAHPEFENETPFEMRKLDGNVITFAETQNEYFKKLQTSWS